MAAKCLESNCIQWPTIKAMNDQLKKIDEKFDKMIEHNEIKWKERDEKLDWFMKEMRETVFNLDKVYVKKDTVKLVFTIIWYFVSLLWAIFWWLFAIAKFILPLFMK